MNLINGQFISVWSNSTVQTAGTLNPVTGEVTAVMANVGNNLGDLEREYFEPKNAEEVDVCRTCHEYILKTEMVPGIGKTLEEVKRCSNPDCPSREE
jgi:hypothetical protein